MRFVVKAEEGTIEVNWMWLPTWVGMNRKLLLRLEQDLSGVFLNREITEALLDEAHKAVIDCLQHWYPDIHGLTDYLHGVKDVQIPEDRSAKSEARTAAS